MTLSDFCWVALDQVPYEIIQEFDCGNEEFNNFLKDRAQDWETIGEAVTYLIVTEEEK